MTDALFDIEKAPGVVSHAARKGAPVIGRGIEAGVPTPRKKRKPKPQVPPDSRPTVELGPGWWRITFAAPERMLSSNTRLHWRVTSPIRKTWREAMYLHAVAAKLPKGLARVRIDVVLRMPTARRTDAPNFHHYVLKPLVDGLGPSREQVIRKGARAGQVVREVGYGLIADDTQQYVDGPHPLIGEPARDRVRLPYGQVVLTITDLSAEVAA